MVIDSAARHHAAANRKVAARKQARRRRMMLIGGAVVAIVAIFGTIFAVAATHHKKKSTAASATAIAGPSLTSKLLVPAAVLAKAGTTGVSGSPTPLSAAPALTKNGKPYVLYVGADYCPFCAAQRWPLIVALSRFGTFSRLSTAASSSSDVFPSTPTFSFHGSTYASQFLTFDGVETSTSELRNGRYVPLDTPTAEQNNVMSTYDRPPYVADNGAIPFLDLGGAYVMQGSGYQPSLLAGKTQQQIADVLADPSSDLGRTINGNANVLTAALCKLTADKPAAVCADPDLAKVRGALDAHKQ